MYYPILAIYQIPSKKKEILKKILEFNQYNTIEDFAIFYCTQQNKTKIAFLELNWEQLLILNSFDFPFIILTDIKNNTKNFKEHCLKENFLGISFLGNPKNWNLPLFSIRKKNKLAIFYNILKFKNIYKKILQINGFHTISFSTLDSIYYYLENESFSKWNEIFIFIDLDKEQNFLKVLYKLTNIAEKNYKILKIFKIILLKDTKEFFYPALINLKEFINSYKYTLPPIKKIFDYYDIIFILIETLFFSQNEITTLSFPSLTDYLYNPEVNYEFKEKNFYQKYKYSFLKYKIDFNKLEPILWYYDLEIKEFLSNSLILS